ncbi:FAD:protein FMN transferase [Flavitalea sp. BT771]|uniref:FAD:protein FMN transferase n=1 Tax=Flavitalea sp. BT771 TaxID=3063329 RepID=UPI0026E298C6|nr:FAD:protein FMN transferase [Flavitalea sp. BT771]MDO6432576.1 FAD:protein FMN transferase [Flavitalea sp. BT771]MDV6222148.1 FAD:protein FMN transferase [Flavitalea sp. BT771]
MNPKHRVCIFFFLLMGMLSFKNDTADPLSAFYISGYAQGTTYHITFFAHDSLVVKRQIDSLLDNIDSSLSIYKPYSIISRFNSAAEGIQMDEHLNKVVRRSLEIYKATGGISDITVYPLMDLWGFGPRHASTAPDSPTNPDSSTVTDSPTTPHSPTNPDSSTVTDSPTTPHYQTVTDLSTAPDCPTNLNSSMVTDTPTTPHPPAHPDSLMVRTTMACVGSDKIHIRDRWLLKDKPCVKIDVNSIAQGYSVDVVAGFLESRGIKNYIVEVGGELRVKGKKYPGGTTLQIGIEAPAQNSLDAPVIEKIVHVDHGAITTSGNYRKYYEINGKKISHLMDPRTGYPFQNELISVTVYAHDAITADGYDNALMGMGLQKAFAFLRRHPGLEAYFIYHREGGEMTDTATAGFYKLM